MLVFDGVAEATKRKIALRERIQSLSLSAIPTVVSIVFEEDTPSVKYASLKQKDAEAIGVSYQIQTLSLADPMHHVHSVLSKSVSNRSIHGVIVQKPAGSLMPSAEWWNEVIAPLTPEKDLDGLTANRKVLPATARAVCEILKLSMAELGVQLMGEKAVVLGRSEIVGKPVAQEFAETFGLDVELWGREALQSWRDQNGKLAQPKPIQAKVLVVATGVSGLLLESDIIQDSIIIDCGAPKPEVEPENLDIKVAFLSPVPGGVGPMTRICLLENLIDLVQYQS